LAELKAVGENVIHQTAEEGDVGPGSQRHVQVGHRTGSGEPWVNVDDDGAPKLRLHHPLEPNRVALGHVGALDDDAVRVGEVLLERRSAAAAERSPQTGDGGGVSNAGLVLDLYRTKGGVQLLHEVVLLVVEGRSSEMRDAHGAAYDVAFVVGVLPGPAPGVDHPLRDHVEGRVEVE